MLTKTQMEKLAKVFLKEDTGKRQITIAKMRRILKAMIIADVKWKLEDGANATISSLFEIMMDASERHTIKQLKARKK